MQKSLEQAHPFLRVPSPNKECAAAAQRGRISCAIRREILVPKPEPACEALATEA